MFIEVELNEAFDYSQSINVYNEGSVIDYGKGDEKFDEILVCFKRLIADAHQMPAYGVSLNSETSKALSVGLWVEFEFGKVYECNGMLFEKLLVNVNKCFYGFNIIRYNAGCGYDGRCFYYDLVNKNMGSLYDILLENQ